MVSSIRIRLTLSYLVVIILAMGLSGFLLLSSLEQYFLQATENALITQAHLTAQALIPGAILDVPNNTAIPQQTYRNAGFNTLNRVSQQQIGNLALQQQTLDSSVENLPIDKIDVGYLNDTYLQFSAQLETRIRILDMDGVVLLDSQQIEQGLNLQYSPLVERALTGQYASHTNRTGDDTTMSLAFPALFNDELVGIVYLSQPLDDVVTVLDDLRTRWVLAMVIALLLSGGVGLLLSQAITKPVRQLTTAAGAVAQGRFDQQVSVRSKDELGQLSRTFNDMTTRLQAAHHMQVNFVANVSHELRTPLTSVKAMVETLRDGAVDDLSVRDHFLETIENETDRLARLVNNLLLLSRVDSEALNIQRQTVDLATLIQSTIDQLTPQSTVKALTFKVDIPPKTPLIWGDSDQIRQVLVNLLDNAMKYSHHNGIITIKIMNKPDQQVLVQVCDQGIGIPAEALPHIGQRFYRTDKARSRSEGGNGLGVAIAQSLVKAHGGQLCLDSQEGHGTVVSFTLPVQ